MSTLEEGVDELRSTLSLFGSQYEELLDELKLLREGHALHVRHGEALERGDFLRAWTIRAQMIEFACKLAGCAVPNDPDVQRCKCGWRLPKDFVVAHSPKKGTETTITIVCPACEESHTHTDIRHVKRDGRA